MRSTSHILKVSVNANSFCVQCSIMASAALTRDKLSHYLTRQVKFYTLSFHVIEIKRLFQRNKLLYYLKGVLLPNTWAFFNSFWVATVHIFLTLKGHTIGSRNKNHTGLNRLEQFQLLLIRLKSAFSGTKKHWKIVFFTRIFITFLFVYYFYLKIQLHGENSIVGRTEKMIDSNQSAW